MAKSVDLTGEKFGNLEVISRATKEEKPKGSYWKCKCSVCGNIVYVVTADLKRRTNRKYCSNCMPNKKGESLVGKVFDRLTVIEEDKARDGYYICECECGTIKSISQQLLKSGHSKSCGCIRKETTRARGKQNKKDLTGKTFGRLTVVGETEDRNLDGQVTWKCRCQCGNTCLVPTSRLTQGNTTSCGCLVKEVAREKFVKLNAHQVGEFHPNWQGGKTEIKMHLRRIVCDWKQEVLHINNYTCNITGQIGGKLQVHHLKSFNVIVDEAHKLNNIEIKSTVSDYTKDELTLLENYVREQHTLDSGVVLTEKLHREFHKLYGYGDNTPKQYYDFKQAQLNSQLNTSSNVA